MTNILNEFKTDCNYERMLSPTALNSTGVSSPSHHRRRPNCNQGKGDEREVGSLEHSSLVRMASENAIEKNAEIVVHREVHRSYVEHAVGGGM